MTKDEYINWKATRSENAADWRRADCVGADRLIKEETLNNLRQHLKRYPEPLRHYVYDMARGTFGSAETDQFLIEAGLYPDWM